MQLLTPQTNWDYELIDSGKQNRLERFRRFLLARPDPQCIWDQTEPKNTWDSADAIFKEKTWNIINPELKANWTISWKDFLFKLHLTPFKHTGLFPEQSTHWEKFLSLSNKKLKILNLFAYTGAASIILAKLGHQITHVDASKPSIAWAKDNQTLNTLPDDSIRWILDDAHKFVKREIKRSKTYDALILDPPAFGHSPEGSTWKFSQDLPNLLKDCAQILPQKPDFLVLNAYATNTSALAIHNLCQDIFPKLSIEFGELCLKQKSGRLISTGSFVRSF